MMTTMSGRPILASSDRHRQWRMARNSGWRRCDLYWEQLQESANRNLRRGSRIRTILQLLLADIIALLQFDSTDLRRAASTANAGFALRLCGVERAARRFYRLALEQWQFADGSLDSIEIAPRARSSLYHMRMEARHRQTYRANRIARLRGFASETGECIACLRDNAPVPHRLYERWRGEKPAIHDDSRKWLAACLLVASDAEGEGARKP